MFDKKEKPDGKEKPYAFDHKKKLVALKDHALNGGDDYKRDIKKGDDLSDVPEHFHSHLKSENVIE